MACALAMARLRPWTLLNCHFLYLNDVSIIETVNFSSFFPTMPTIYPAQRLGCETARLDSEKYRVAEALAESDACAAVRERFPGRTARLKIRFGDRLGG